MLPSPPGSLLVRRRPSDGCGGTEIPGVWNPRRKVGGTPSMITAAEIDQLVARLGDPTAHEMTAEFNRARRHRERVHVSSMKRALRRHGYVVKKNAEGRWSVYGRMSSPD